ncbi:MAG: pyridoxal phosphate-dependent aminotransferase [Candidatus Omnitrophica bacterium]|nr:pyridoxal phosphate-dependent aminotransferase [Candidatus Omnitrophota bacterium]
MFAKRTDWKFDFNPLTRRLNALKKRGRPILDLTASNPTRCAFHYPSDMLSSLKDPENREYRPSPKGLFQAREVITRYYSGKGVALNPEHLFLTSSTSEAYSFLFRLLLNPGEHLLIPQPSYPLFEYLATLNDIVATPYPLRYRRRWAIDLERIPEKILTDTRAMIVVHPNNPTGSFVKKKERSFLIRLSQEKGLSLIADEVFLDYAYPEVKKSASFAGERSVLTFTLGGISKTLGLPQMKVAWIVVSGPKRLRDAAIERLEVISDTTLSVNTPSQQALAKWFSFRSQIQKEIQERVVLNRGYLLRQCHTTKGCEVLHAEGGWYAILRLPSLQSEEAWVLEFLEKERVLTHPGYFYDLEEGAHVVLSLLVPSDLFEEGIARLLTRVSRRV